MVLAAPFHPNRHFDQIDDNVEHHVGLAYHKFANCLQSQFDNIGLLDANANKKDLLRRLLDFPKKFLNRPDARNTSREQYGEQVEKIYVNILNALIVLCSKDDEQDEADELLFELHGLDMHKPLSQDIQWDTSLALERRSQAVHRAFTELEVPRNKRIVSDTDDSVFPVNNAAIELGMNWSTLRSMPSGSSSNSRGSEGSSRPHDTIGRGPLHVAVERSNAELVCHFASIKPNLEDRDSLQMTPLLLAALRGNLRVFQSLLQAGASLEARDRYGRNAMIIACESANLDVVRFLLQQSKHNANEEYELQECTLLYAAASKGHHTVVQLLINAGADAGKRVQGKLPLEAALEQRHAKVAQMLEQAVNGTSATIPLPAIHQPTEDLSALTFSPNWHEADDDDGFSLLLNDTSTPSLEHAG